MVERLTTTIQNMEHRNSKVLMCTHNNNVTVNMVNAQANLIVVNNNKDENFERLYFFKHKTHNKCTSICTVVYY